MTVQKHVRLDDDTAKFVEDWRAKQRPIPNFNEAINLIIQEYKLKIGLVIIQRCGVAEK